MLTVVDAYAFTIYLQDLSMGEGDAALVNVCEQPIDSVTVTVCLGSFSSVQYSAVQLDTTD